MSEKLDIFLKDADEAAIRADERRVTAELMTESEHGTIGRGPMCDICIHAEPNGCDLVKPNEKCPIRKAGGL